MGTNSTRALVSVVTPFYNTARYLRECIESVLNQTYGNFEYILHDNASDDGSSDIAREYAAKDNRIRLIRIETLLPQVPNYNRALTYISPGSRYCKIVQADDWIFPECLDRMVALADSDPRIGLVSSLRLEGKRVRGEGLSYEQTVLTGRDSGRLHLLGSAFLFGSPTTVLVRGDIVRTRHPFFEENRFQEDTETCFEILKGWDFGYVHQILTYSRVAPDSLFSSLSDYDTIPLGNVINLHRYGPHFLAPSELGKRWNEGRRWYYEHLATAFLGARGREYWRFQRTALATEGLSIEAGWLAWAVAREVIDILGNPKTSLWRLLRRLRAWRNQPRPR
jgi:glycosyltransferase involved in cell wall biosynthesis